MSLAEGIVAGRKMTSRWVDGDGKAVSDPDEHHPRSLRHAPEWLLTLKVDEEQLRRFPDGAQVELRVVGPDIQASHWPEHNEVQSWIDAMRWDDGVLAEYESLARWCEERLANLASPQTTSVLVALEGLVKAYERMRLTVEHHKAEKIDIETEDGLTALRVLREAESLFQAALEGAKLALAQSRVEV